MMAKQQNVYQLAEHIELYMALVSSFGIITACKPLHIVVY